MRRLVELVVRLTGSTRAPRVAALLAFLVALPTAFTPFFGDDLLHDYVLRGNRFPGGPRGFWDLYRFADGGDGIRECIARGVFPWWSSPDLELSFFRPLASLWRAADHVIWSERPLPAHLETCAVYALAAAVVAILYRRWIGGAAAGLAAVIFAIDDAHALPVTWTANRYAVLAGLFAFASFAAHLRAREAAGPRWPAPVLFAAALLSGETALGVLGYFVAYAWLCDRGGRAAGLRALAPLALPLGAWAVLYRALHYGAHGSAFYVDPLDAPMAFVKALPLRLPLLALGQVFGPPAEVWAFMPMHPAVSALVATIVAAIFYVLLFRCARGHRVARALVVGSLLAAIPVCGVSADDRGLFLPGVGIAGLLGVALERHASSFAERRPGLGARVFFGVVAFAHLVAAPVLFPLRGRNTAATLTSATNRSEATMPRDLGIEGRTLVILGGPDALTTSLAFVRRLTSDEPKPRRACQLTTQVAGVATVVRDGERTIEIRNPDGELGGALSLVYRDTPLRPGDSVTTDMHRAEVLALAPNGLPSAVRFTFTEPLEAMRWIVWQGQGYVEVPPPVDGAPRRYPSTDMLSFLTP